ncbi:MAG: tRNA (N6-threonylcarbamoyladenosine(37)-N6)-methyltransferase TrmO, partial [Gemmatimonadota bacterium]
MEPRLRPIGVIRSPLKTRGDAPMQGSEGAPDAWLEIYDWAAQGLHRLAVGDRVIVITWLHQADREVLEVHPR